NNFPRGGQVHYVLSPFDPEELELIDDRLDTAGEIIKSFCLAGINNTMNLYNNK
ncbi:MAG: aminoacyl-tRNA hydrolase, partial [Bacteroidales bacterium]|nr:aminoacyl-tRNA hydrolase [Bacteroidales bacterium]